MLLLTDEENESYINQAVCHIYKKEFDDDNDDDYQSYQKVRDHCHCTVNYRSVALGICNLRYKTLKEIHVVFHYGSNYDYHFIINELAEELEGHFECSGENT